MQRSDSSTNESIPLLNDLDVDLDAAERGILMIDVNKISHAKSLIVRLEECIHALNMQINLHNRKDTTTYHSALTFYHAAMILTVLSPVIIETIIISGLFNLPIDVFSSYDELHCTTTSCLIAECEKNYPIQNLTSPWPYAYPTNYNDTTLVACYQLYNKSIYNAYATRDLAIVFLTFANILISISCLAIACLGLPSLKPTRKPSFSDSTILMMLPEEMQKEINYLATQTKTSITDCFSINQIIEAFRLALDERQRARQRRAFLSGSLAQNESSPLYRFFNGQTVNDKHVRGDGDMATTERIFKYAGLLK